MDRLPRTRGDRPDLRYMRRYLRRAAPHSRG